MFCRPALHGFMLNPFMAIRPYVSLDDDLDPSSYEVDCYTSVKEHRLKNLEKFCHLLRFKNFFTHKKKILFCSSSMNAVMCIFLIYFLFFRISY